MTSSASMRATTRPRQRSRPEFSAATRLRCGAATTRKRPSRAAKRSATARVPSVEPSSTMMHSQRGSLCRATLRRQPSSVASAW